MYTYYLRFSYQKTMNTVLFDKQVDSEGVEFLTPKYTAVDVIGRIYKPTGNMLTDSEGNQTPEMTMQTGFYANVRNSEIAPELEQYQVFPATPERTWA